MHYIYRHKSQYEMQMLLDIMDSFAHAEFREGGEKDLFSPLLTCMGPQK